MADKEQKKQKKQIMADKEQKKPSAASTSPSVVPVGAADVEPATAPWPSVQYLRKRRCVLWCYGCCSGVVVVLGVVVLALSLTVFKVKDPTLTMNAIALEGLSFSVDPDAAMPVSLNATLTADISIENPNMASFRFDRSTTDFYYEGQEVGVVYAPAGSVSAHETARMKVRVDVLTDRVATRMNLTREVLSSAGAELNLTSFTDVSGRVSVLRVYKRNLDLMLNCSMTLDVSLWRQELKRTQCFATVK